MSLVAGLALVASASAASAQGMYAGGYLGAGAGQGEIANSGFDIDFVAGGNLGVFVGTDRGNLRFEGELAYRQNDLEFVGFSIDSDITSTALMGNIYYDFGDQTGANFYVGGGLGFASVTFDSPPAVFDTNDTDLTFALQLMLGGAFPVGQSGAAFVELRSFGAVPTFEDNTGFPFEQEYFITSLMVGYRFGF